MSSQNVSLVIISRNRDQFVARAFRYLSLTGFKGEVLLGDASSKQNRLAIERLIEYHSKFLNINATFYDTNSPPISRLVREFSKVTREFCAWLGDDDFLITDSLERAAEQLSLDSNVAAVVGKSLVFNNSGSQALGKWSQLGHYSQRGYIQDKPEERIDSFVTETTALAYSLRRSAFTKNLYSDLELLALPDDPVGYYFFETMLGLLIVAQGKVRKIENLTMVRQVHSTSTAATGSLGELWSRIVTSDQYTLLIERCIETLARTLRKANSNLDRSWDVYSRATILRSIQRTTDRFAQKDSGQEKIRLRTRLARQVNRILPDLYRHLKYRYMLRGVSPKDRKHLEIIFNVLEGKCDQHQLTTL